MLDPEEVREAWKRDNCYAAYVHLIWKQTPWVQTYVRSKCSHPWCVPCDKLRRNALLRKIIDYIEWWNHKGVKTWWFLTRSIRNERDASQAFKTFSENRRSFHNRSGRKDHPWNKVPAWIGVQEITHNDQTGYNVHQHMLVAKPLKGVVDWKATKDRWEAPLSYEAMTHVKLMDQSRGAVAYLSKYMSKADVLWGGLPVGHSLLYSDVLKGRNRINCMRGTKPPKFRPYGFDLCCCPPEMICNRAQDGYILAPHLGPNPDWDYLNEIRVREEE